MPRAPRPKSLAARVDAHLRAMGGIEKRPSRFERAREAYWYEGVELLHFHDESELDIRLTRAVIRERRELLAQDPRIVLGRADWVVFRARDLTDHEDALVLVRAACEANRPKRQRRRTVSRRHV